MDCLALLDTHRRNGVVIVIELVEYFYAVVLLRLFLLCSLSEVDVEHDY